MTCSGCNPLKVITFQNCNVEDHFITGMGFWAIVLISLLIFGIYSLVTSPEYIKEQLIIEQKWKYIQEMAGCNDLKYELDELLVLRERERTNTQDKMIKYLKERVAWTCSSEARGTSD